MRIKSPECLYIGHFYNIKIDLSIFTPQVFFNECTILTMYYNDYYSMIGSIF